MTEPAQPGTFYEIVWKAPENPDPSKIYVKGYVGRCETLAQAQAKVAALGLSDRGVVRIAKVTVAVTDVRATVTA